MVNRWIKVIVKSLINAVALGLANLMFLWQSIPIEMAFKPSLILGVLIFLKELDKQKIINLENFFKDKKFNKGLINIFRQLGL